MSNQCKGTCKDGVNKSYHITYINGYKFCRACNKYFLQESWLCKCCKTRLRGKPANGARREILVSDSRIGAKGVKIIETS